MSSRPRGSSSLFRSNGSQFSHEARQRGCQGGFRQLIGVSRVGTEAAGHAALNGSRPEIKSALA